jgi:hypothetical protein
LVASPEQISLRDAKSSQIKPTEARRSTVAERTDASSSTAEISLSVTYASENRLLR